jgi:transposase
MIPAGLRMFVAVEPIDMRRSIDGLVLAVSERLRQDAKAERALYAFANARRDRVKIIWRTTTGWCLLYTRLDAGHRVPLPAAPAGAVSVAVDARSLAAILDGVKRRPTTREVVREARTKAQITSPTSTAAR